MDCKKEGGNGCCELDMGRGARFCNCGEEPQAEMCEGCFKLHATDWLEGLPEQAPDDIFEVRFKNTRRSYYQNVNGIDLQRGDIVAVESSPGHDIGIVSLTGDMVARQMKRVGFNPLNGEFKKIYRKAKPYDIEKWQEAIAMEHETMIASRQIAAEMGLNMKIGDVEYQGDKIKAIFYYIADERVDFRELIKVFAEQFRIRVEMKQIGARQEAGRIGGLGSCGRELCCASWISSFASVTTNSARTQEISLNPQKLAGQCSKLKCCLAYELDSYIDARKEFPRLNGPLQAIDGDYHLVKTDILARTMSFSTSPNALAGMVVLPLERVRKIMALNREGKKVDRIESHVVVKAETVDPGFVNMVGEDSITRFDKPQGERRGRGKKNRRRGEGPEGMPKPAGDQEKRPDVSDGQRPAGERDGQRRQGRDGRRPDGRQGGNREGQRHEGREQGPQQGENRRGEGRQQGNNQSASGAKPSGDRGGRDNGGRQEGQGGRQEGQGGDRGRNRSNQGNRGNDRGGQGGGRGNQDGGQGGGRGSQDGGQGGQGGGRGNQDGGQGGRNE